MKTLRHFRSNEDGAALVEMTVAAPFLIALTLGAMVFGQAMLDYTTVDKSMRDATRFLARVPAGAVCGWGLDRAKNIAVYGQETTSNNPPALINGWSTSTVTLESPDCGSTPSGTFDVRLRTAFPSTNTMLSAIGLPNTFTMNVRHEQPSIGH
jgi:Flp pilus assembly pilin Flp